MLNGRYYKEINEKKGAKVDGMFNKHFKKLSADGN